MRNKVKAVIISGIIALTSFEGYSQSNVVFYGSGSNALNVAFADVTLSAAAKSTITADLNLCLSVWGKEAQLSIEHGADEPGFVGYLERASKSPHWPDNLEFPEGLVSNATTGLALYIPRNLSDAYTNAIAFATANSNAIAAAYQFVSFVNSTNFAKIQPTSMPNYIMFKNALPDAAAESNAIVNLAPQIMEDILYSSYYKPSLLGFYNSANGPAQDNLWVLVPISIPRGEKPRAWETLAAIWHEGKWRFCDWMVGLPY